MAKVRKTKRSRFDGIDLNTLNKEVAKVTGQPTTVSNKQETPKEEKIEPKAEKPVEVIKEKAISNTRKVKDKKVKATEELPKRGKGRPKSSSRKPLNTAIEPKNRQRLEFLAMLNGGSVADQLNDILERYFTEVEKVDELIDIFEERKRKRK